MLRDLNTRSPSFACFASTPFYFSTNLLDRKPLTRSCLSPLAIMRSPCAPSTSQRCLSSGLIARPRASPKAGARKRQRRAMVDAAASAADEENKTTSSTSSSSAPSRSPSSWTATDGERSEDFLQALGTRQQYNITVDHGARRLLCARERGNWSLLRLPPRSRPLFSLFSLSARCSLSASRSHPLRPSKSSNKKSGPHPTNRPERRPPRLSLRRVRRPLRKADREREREEDA